jgi:hypothetical protein
MILVCTKVDANLAVLLLFAIKRVVRPNCVAEVFGLQDLSYVFLAPKMFFEPNLSDLRE